MCRYQQLGETLLCFPLAINAQTQWPLIAVRTNFPGITHALSNYLVAQFLLLNFVFSICLTRALVSQKNYPLIILHRNQH